MFQSPIVCNKNNVKRIFQAKLKTTYTSINQLKFYGNMCIKI